MAASLTFVAASRKRGLTPHDLATIGAWLGLPAWHDRPLPPGRAGVVLTTEGVRLHVPGGGAGWWPAGLTAQRTERGHDDPLLRAVRPAPGLRVLDATLGLGHDALIVARHGAHVLGLEHEAALLFYAAEGLRRHDAEATRRIAFRRADHRDFLAHTPAGAFDVVSLDPMFPDAGVPRSATLALLRRTALRDAVTPATLAHALRVARQRVVLRLPPAADPPVIPGGPPARIEASKRVRVAVWDRP